MRKISQAMRAAGKRNDELNGHRSRGRQNALIAMEADLLGGTIEPLMPANLMLEKVLGSLLGKRAGAQRYKQARELSEANDFFGSINYLKELFFNDGFSFGEAANAKLKNWLKKTGYDFSRVVNDAWQEWLICDNVVAFWERNESDKLPIVTILDCEVCDYKNAFGVETLTLKFPNMSYSSAQMDQLKKKGLPQRYIDALKGGKNLTLDQNQGECFRVLTRAKLGKGLAPPRVGLVLQELSTMELFSIGDWAWAAQLKKAMRQIKKGHEIRNGPLAGQPIHFLTKADAKQIHDQQKNKDGAYDAVTNFDLAVNYPFPDLRVFDTKKMEGTLSRLERWAGPVGRLLMGASEQSPFVMDAFEVEGFRQRKLVGDFLASIFNDETFLGDQSPPLDLIPRWNPLSFISQKNLNELGRLCGTNGWLSPQTARSWFGMDEGTESDNMKKAGKNKSAYTPPFEPRQGIVSGRGGRPAQTPSGEPQPNE